MHFRVNQILCIIRVNIISCAQETLSKEFADPKPGNPSLKKLTGSHGTNPYWFRKIDGFPGTPGTGATRSLKYVVLDKIVITDKRSKWYVVLLQTSFYLSCY